MLHHLIYQIAIISVLLCFTRSHEDFTVPKCERQERLIVRSKHLVIGDVEERVKAYRKSGRFQDFYRLGYTYDCGRQPLDLIVSGKEAMPNAWPWQVLLNIKQKRNHLLCGGTLISNRWLITAAHCRSAEANEIEVFLGVNDLRLRYERAVIRMVVSQDDIFIHPRYNSSLPESTPDLALVKLRYPIEFSSNIRPACLPQTAETLPKKCITLGWGKTEGMFKGSISQLLKELEVRLFYTQRLCQKKAIFYCGRSVDTTKPSGVCAGDSGGGLLCKHGDVYYVAGVVSHGAEDCDQRIGKYPGFYTNISHFLQWINDTINNSH